MEADSGPEAVAESEHLRSPSPTPAPPVETTPGPRATALQRIYAKATADILKTCSYGSFAACFPTPARERPESLQDLHSQFIASLGKSMRANFDDILEERDVVRSLNELDRLIREAKKARAHAQSIGGNACVPTPAHTIPARQLSLAHMASSLSDMSESLTARQSQLATANEELIESVMLQRRQIKDLTGRLEDVVQELATAAATLSPEEIDRLREENRSANASMETTTDAR